MTTCPTCRADAVPALFGRPVEAAQAAGEAGDLALLGCFIPDEPPHYSCASGHTWRIDDVGRWQAELLAALRKHGYDEPADDNA